ncbi:hypothetical protein [Nonomuraea sp. NPDC050310]|uniref:hypothetical protein n=1 Tax=Nonomuraea sp. NPDC050310 TaxID=3154935 RepID=UPI0033EF5AD6
MRTLRQVATAALLTLGAGACSLVEGVAAPAGTAAPSSPAPSFPPAVTFTDVAQGCELLDPETLAKYAPGADCRPDPEDDRRTQNEHQVPILQRGPRWAPGGGPPEGEFSGVIDVHLKVNQDTFTEFKENAHRSVSGGALIDGEPVAGVGDEAALYYAIGDGQGYNLDRTTGIMVSRWGNATLRVIYWHYKAKSDRNPSERQMRKALTAITRDVYDDLS